jgi:hypothetical protein
MRGLRQARKAMTWRSRNAGEDGAIPSSKKPCQKFEEGRNCRRGARCTFLHGDYVPAMRTEQQKTLLMEQMLRSYLRDETPSGQVELFVDDVAAGSKKQLDGALRCYSGGHAHRWV